jgi:hypothetical protein
MSNIFEQPWTLLIAAMLVLIVLLIVRAVLPAKRHWWQWLVPVFIAAAAFGLDLLVQTDIEKIRSVINTASKAVEEENPAAIEPLISPDYSDSYHITKTRLISHCRAHLAEPLIEKNITRISEIDIQGTKATALFTVRIVFDKRSYVYQEFKQLMLIKLQAQLQKQPDGGWLISRAEIVAIDRQPAKWQHIVINWPSGGVFLSPAGPATAYL